MNENDVNPLAFSPIDGARQLSIGRTQIYKLIAEGRLRTIKLGRRTLIRASELQAFLDRLEAATRTGAEG